MVQHPTTTFNVHVVSEGYVSEQLFNNDCKKLRDKLLSLSPFNMLRAYPGSFTIHTHFEASTQSGPRITNTSNDQSFVPGNTPLDSVFNTVQSKLYINTASLNTLVGSLMVRHSTEAVSVMKTIHTSIDPDFTGMGVVFVLLPEQTGLSTINNSLVEMESRTNIFYFAASSANTHFELTLARAIARSIGLADEFGLYSPTYNAPTTQAQIDSVSKVSEHRLYPLFTCTKFCLRASFQF